MKGFGFRIILQNATQFHRGLVKPLHKKPISLLRFASSPPYQACTLRQQLAQELESTADHELDVNALKIKMRFPQGIQFAALTGMCSEELFQTFHQARRTIKPSVRGNERAHSILSSMSKRAPNIQLPLLSSRLTIKTHFEGYLDNRYKNKMARVRARGQELVRLCIDHTTECKATLEKAERWEFAQPLAPLEFPELATLQDLPQAEGPEGAQQPKGKQPAEKNDLLQQIAIAHDIVLHKEMQQHASNAPCVIAIGDDLWFVGDCYRYRTYLVSAVENPDESLSVAEPFSTETGEDVFKNVLASLNSTVDVTLVPLTADFSTAAFLSRDL